MATGHLGVSLPELTGQLADLHKRLDLLAAGEDHRTAVRAVLSWSYHHLVLRPPGRSACWGCIRP